MHSRFAVSNTNTRSKHGSNSHQAARPAGRHCNRSRTRPFCIRRGHPARHKHNSSTGCNACVARASPRGVAPDRRSAGNACVTENVMSTQTFTKTTPPDWLLAFWKEIDDKTFGKGFDCFTKDAVCNLGVADWHGREGIRENLREFIDTGFTAHHEVTEYWDGGPLKVFRGIVTMTPDDQSQSVV